MERRNETAAVKRALKGSGINASVKHGNGTAWGWLDINIEDPTPAHNHGEETFCPSNCPNLCGCHELRNQVISIVRSVTGRSGEYDGRTNVNFHGPRGVYAAPATN